MERMQVLFDSSENTPPRGFPGFDKLQLDPVRREYMKKLRVEMLDHNEEYLAKHPQVEAILRLIVMEVLCHKPFDVRKFIKELLMSPNLETRVAKIILSKRINLERNHTREYFRHIAEWEQKADISTDYKELDSQVWPEPRPSRKEGRKDKPGYSHLHYFKKPYWLYPKEFMKVAAKPSGIEVKKLPKLPKWKSAFLMANFFQKWGYSFNLQAEDLKMKRTVHNFRTMKIKKSKKTRKTIRKTFGIKERLNGRKIDCADENKNLIMRCPSCRIAVANLHPDMDDCGRLRTMRLTTSKKSSSMYREPKLSTEVILDEMDGLVERAESVRVHWDGKRPVDERDRPLKEVWAVIDEMRKKSGESFCAMIHRGIWDIKQDGEEISFVIPSNEITKIDQKLILDKYYVDDEEIPQRYKAPSYQVLISKV